MNDLTNGWVWLGLIVFGVLALSFDRLILNKKYARPHQSMRAAFFWSLLWIFAALIFNGLLWCYLYISQGALVAQAKALDFLTGYLIEKSLSVDNLFVFYVIFKQLHIPVKYQQRVFAYGIWGAVLFRLLLILLGSWLIARFHWLLYLMGAFLLFTGVKMLAIKEKEKDLVEVGIIRLLKRFFRVTHEFNEESFFIRKNQLLYATPLFVALILIEFSDVMFAFDSIPAIFAITRDPFIVWSANIFAILGLRAMYFLLASVAERFHLLKIGVALILVFVGIKMLIEPWCLISVKLSLMVVMSILAIFIAGSLLRK